MRLIAKSVIGLACLGFVPTVFAQAPAEAPTVVEPGSPSVPANGATAESPPASPAEPAVPDTLPGRSWSGPPQKPASKKTFWETVPPITSYPRAGNFVISPSGPGAYTLLQAIRGESIPTRPRSPYLQWGQNPNPLFNVDFRYLDDPKNKEHDWLDPLKRIHLGPDWLFSTGGEIRERYATIQNAALYNKKPQAGNDNDFNLFRTRIYGDLWYRDFVRLYAEFITAQSSSQSIPLSSSDAANADIQNLFVEAKVAEVARHPVYVRIGRQELLYGSQRLIAPSDWANVRRTFQGVRAYVHGEKFEQDLFLVQPVVISPTRISSIDDRQLFLGEYFKYRFTKDISADFYYLYLQNHNPGVAKGQGTATGTFDSHTFGSRFLGEYRQWLWDFENAIQFGPWANQSTLAGISVSGVGYYFKNVPTTPTLWVYYDYASGDQNPGQSGTHGTFNTLFPFGHSYYAGLDAFGRQNINDFHIEMALFPQPWVRIVGGWHLLTLDSPKDALYSTSGSVVRQDPTGKAGRDIGNALSSGIQFHLTNHQVFFVGYSHLFSGEFIRKTAATPAAARDLDALWVQYTLKW